MLVPDHCLVSVRGSLRCLSAHIPPQRPPEGLYSPQEPSALTAAAGEGSGW
jgi:hypothetical protein